MKKAIVGILALVIMSACLSACKGNDYQHPMHRTGQVTSGI